MREEKIHIRGMTCVSCEIMLEKQLKKVAGLQSCNVSHKKGYADIVCEESVPRRELELAIRRAGYKVGKEHEAESRVHHKNTSSDYFQITTLFLGMLIVVYILSKMQLSRFFPDISSNVTVVVALLMGVVASLSTCLALTGGIVMSFGATVALEGDKSRFWGRAVPHLYFHAGRIGGFILLGGVLGLVGSKINYSLTFTGYLTIIIAAVMFYVGLNILNLVPSITRLGFHLPKGLSQKIGSLQESNHHFAPMLIGTLTFFLPCGFTQSMQLAAVTSQSFTAGAMIMGAFAIGTMPILVAVGIGSTYAHANKMQVLYRLIGIVIIFFSLYSLNSGLVLAGSPVSYATLKGSSTGGSEATVEIKNGVQIVKMAVDWSYQPNEFRIKKGVPVRWEIDGVNLSGCSNQIVVPSLNLRKKLVEGKNIVEFTPTQAGSIPFSCWMGMIGGRFIVTE